MPPETLISVRSVSKKFCRDLKRSLFYGLKDMGSELLGHNATGRTTLRKKEFWALDDVSFELKRGECLGLIGHNGAGKSTLLKMLSGLIKPDTGRIEMRGRIGALIELGAGFNPILTGRENIYINASVLGLTKKETDDLFDQIVDFSELNDFIDTPVQYYSSGMKVRLGFAVASQMKPDILLVDEVLAVGDLDFKIKCYNEIYRIIESATVILVSHSLTQIAKVSSKCMLLKNGKTQLISEKLEDVFEEYFKGIKTSKGTSISGNGTASISDIWIYQDNQTDKHYFRLENNLIDYNVFDDLLLYYGESLSITLKTKLLNSSDLQIGLAFTDMESKIVAQCLSVNSTNAFKVNRSEFIIQVTIPKLELAIGKYSLSVGIYSSDGRDIAGVVLLSLKDMLEFQVSSRKKLYGAAPVQLSGVWNINP